ncbi:MAG: PAS domain S-box protein, partial [Desulfohalobiaceae bacterium]|nr:PAS domain S-box protein [Desulfohalobiaceae bacterium]
ESDNFIKGQLQKGEFCLYKCKNGLWDIGIPIIVHGKHLATMFLGQFFYENEIPERQFFIDQARQFGFDRDAYLKALDQVPYFSNEKVESILTYNKSLAGFITNLAEGALSRKEAEKQLWEHNQVMQGILEHTHMMAVYLDTQFNFIWVNRAYAVTCRHDQSYFPGKNHFDLYPHSENQAIFQRVVDTGEPFFVEAKAFEFPDQPERGPTYWDWSLIPIKNNSGKVIGLVFTLAEVTERILVEKRLRKSEEDFRTLIENVIDWVWIIDESGRYTYASPQAEVLMGYTADEILGKTPFDFMSPAEAETIAPLFFQALKNRDRILGLEDTLVSKDGSEVIFETNATPLYSSEGEFIGYMGTCRDITNRKLAENELRESEKRISSIFRSAPAGIGVVVNRVFTEINSRLCEITGYAEGDLINQSARILYPGDQEFELVGREKYVQIAERGTGTVETRWQRKDGAIIDVLLSSTPIDLKDQSKGVTFTALDITSKKRAEKERARLQAQLNQSQKMESVGRLAGGVAHDFNNMLSVILGNTEMALEDVDQDHALFSNLQEVQKAALRSTEVVRQLLAFARKQTIAPKVLDLNATIEEMLKMLRRLIGEDIDLSWQPGSGLWPVKMDPAQIDQILVNLSVNARDAIAGVGKLTIETGKETFDKAFCADHQGFLPGDFVLLAVSDNGCGMDEETLEYLFEPFYSTKDVGKGTGLGLATVYGIVKQNNGFVDVRSEPNQGTTFRIYLPSFAACDEVMPEKDQTEQISQESETILLVEDEPTILKMIRMMLERLGYEVLTAETPGEAIKLARLHSGNIHLLMTDVVMPEMNGRDLAKNLLSMYPNMKRLFMSGYTADVIAHHGVLDQGVNFIQKPFSRQDLSIKVHEALDEADAKR